MTAASKNNLKYLKSSLQANCLYCGKSIEDNLDDFYMHHNDFYVEWRTNIILFLHPKCALEFSTHLIRDVRSGELQVEFNIDNLE